jgi:hypothetical protein
MSTTIDILNKFAKDVQVKAKKNVHDYKINSGGKLRKSIVVRVKEEKNKDYSVTVEMEDYGDLRDAGQLGSKRKILKGWNKSIFLPRGKGFKALAPPPDAIKKWIRTKPIRSTTSLNSLAYLISRKIKTEGIQPGLFFSDAFNEYYPKLEKVILDGLDKDIDNALDKI